MSAERKSLWGSRQSGRSRDDDADRRRPAREQHQNHRSKPAGSGGSGSSPIGPPPFINTPQLQTPDDVARTVYAGNLVPSVTVDQFLGLFAICGPISYYRLNVDRAAPPPPAGASTSAGGVSRYGFVEFTEVEGYKNALALNGYLFYGRALKVSAANNPIMRPLLAHPSEVPPRVISDMLLAAAKINTKLGITDSELLDKISATRS